MPSTMCIKSHCVVYTLVEKKEQARDKRSGEMVVLQSFKWTGVQFPKPALGGSELP